MGLDACVYLRRESLPARFQSMHLNHDPETGEWYPDDSVPYDQSEVCAVKERIGNVSTIAHIRALLEKRPDQTFALRRLLENAFVTGVVYSMDQAARLEVEAIELERDPIEDPSIAVFIKQIKTLAAASRRERNPIVL